MGSGSSFVTVWKLSDERDTGDRRPEIFSASRRLGLVGGLEVHDDAAAGVAARDRLFQDDLGVPKVLRGDAPEDIRCHHAQRRAAENPVLERARAIVKNDCVVALLNNEQIAFDSALEIDQYLGNLCAIQVCD